MTEQDKWIIEGRDVFIDRWGDNGIETMTVKEAEAILNEHSKLKRATEALTAEQARDISNRNLTVSEHEDLQAYADALAG